MISFVTLDRIRGAFLKPPLIISKSWRKKRKRRLLWKKSAGSLSKWTERLYLKSRYYYYYLLPTELNLRLFFVWRNTSRLWTLPAWQWNKQSGDLLPANSWRESNPDNLMISMYVRLENLIIVPYQIFLSEVLQFKQPWGSVQEEVKFLWRKWHGHCVTTLYRQ